MQIAEALEAQDRQTVMRPPWVDRPRDPAAEAKAMAPIHKDRALFERLVAWVAELESRWNV